MDNFFCLGRRSHPASDGLGAIARRYSRFLGEVNCGEEYNLVHESPANPLPLGLSRSLPRSALRVRSLIHSVVPSGSIVYHCLRREAKGGSQLATDLLPIGFFSTHNLLFWRPVAFSCRFQVLRAWLLIFSWASTRPQGKALRPTPQDRPRHCVTLHKTTATRCAPTAANGTRLAWD